MYWPETLALCVLQAASAAPPMLPGASRTVLLRPHCIGFECWLSSGSISPRQAARRWCRLCRNYMAGQTASLQLGGAMLPGRHRHARPRLRNQWCSV